MRTLITLFVFLLCGIAGYATHNDIKINHAANDGYRVVPRPGGGFILYQSFVQKVSYVNSQGQVEWEQTIQGDIKQNFLMDMAVGADTCINLIIIRRAFVAEVEYFVVRLDPNGKILYSKSFDPGSSESITDHSLLKAEDDGGLTFAAIINDRMTAIRLNASGALEAGHVLSLPNATATAKDAVPVDDTSMVVVGAAGNNANSGPLILKISNNGVIDWSIHYTDGNSTCPTSIYKSRSGHFIVTGFYISKDRVVEGGFVMKIDAAGNVVWRKKFVATTWQMLMRFKRVMENEEGDIIVAGEANGYYGLTRIITHLNYNGDVLSCKGIRYDDAYGGATNMFKLINTTDGIILSDLYFNRQDSIVYSVLLDVTRPSAMCYSSDFYIAEVADTITNLPAAINVQPAIPPIDINNTAEDANVVVYVRDYCESTLSVNDLKNDVDFTLSPNPVGKGALVTVSSPGTNPVNSVAVYDIHGRLVKQLSGVKSGRVEVETSGLQSGLYTVMLNGSSRAVKKLVVTE